MSLVDDLLLQFRPGYRESGVERRLQNLGQTEQALTPKIEGSDSVEPGEGESPITEKLDKPI